MSIRDVNQLQLLLIYFSLLCDLLITKLINYLTIHLSSETLSGRYGEHSTLVHIYYSCRSHSLSGSPTLSSHHAPQLPVSVSLFISPSVTNLHHLPVSNCQFFPSLSPFTCCRSLSPCFFYFFDTSPLSLSDTPLSVSVTLSGLLPSSPPPSCFVCVVSSDFRKWSYIHDSVMWKTHFSLYSLRPSGETARLYIHKCKHPHRHAFSRIVHVTSCSILLFGIIDFLFLRLNTLYYKLLRNTVYTGLLTLFCKDDPALCVSANITHSLCVICLPVSMAYNKTWKAFINKLGWKSNTQNTLL